MPKRHSRAALAAFAVALIAAALLVRPAPAAALAPYIYIDAGHGGPYSNANENGLYEKDVNLLIALELQQRLLAEGYRVGMDRTSDVAVCKSDIPTWHWLSDGPHLYSDGTVSSGVPVDDLQARANLANRNGADLMISIHCNGLDDSRVTGIETFACTFDPLAQRLSSLVQEEMIASTGAVDRGDKTTNYYVIRWSNMPAILIESGFISNPLEASRLGNPVYRWLLARSIARGVDRFFAEEPFQSVYPRMQGADRYETAAKASRSAWPNGAKTVLLASGTNWPDALTAAPLSKKLDAPLLLTLPGGVPASTKAELARLKPSRVIVLGSEASVSATAAAEATRAASGTTPVQMTRLGGANRYETAALVADQVGIASGRIAIASGRSFADALSLSPYAGRLGYPILLAGGDPLPAATQAFVAAHRAAIKGVVVAGGTSSVPNASVAALPSVTRIAGSDTWSTNAAFVKTWGATSGLLVANGLGFPDGLVAGAYGAKVGRPLLLVQPRVLPDRAREYLELSGSRLTALTVFGGPATIPELMDWEIQKALD